MFIVGNNDKIELPTCSAKMGLELAQAQAHVDSAGYDLHDNVGRVVATVHPTHTEVMAWAKKVHSLED